MPKYTAIFTESAKARFEASCDGEARAIASNRADEVGAIHSLEAVSYRSVYVRRVGL